MKYVAALALVVALPCLSACRAAEPDARPAGSIPVDGPTVPAMRAGELVDLVTTPQLEPTEHQLEVLAQVRDLGAGFFAATPPADVLDEVELVYFIDGASLELAELYLEAVRAQGVGSPMRPRLAWLYHRLAMKTQALAQAELAVAERPDDAQAHFVYGYVRFDPEAHDADMVGDVRTAFERVLALDPAFRGPGGSDAAGVRAEVDALVSMTGAR